MHDWLQRNLRCPRDRGVLLREGDRLYCDNRHSYDVVDGVPIMLIKEVAKTHDACEKSLFGSGEATEMPTPAPIEHGIDPFVQKAIAATNGIMWKPVIGKLTRYPIPRLPLPKSDAGKYFLDIGCNWGRWCVSAGEKGYFPVGIDPDYEAVLAAQRLAKKIGMNAVFVVADGRYLPFKSQCFDVAYSYSVLQHFSKDDARICLKEVSRVLKEAGFCLIQLPNIFGLRNIFNQAKRGFREARDFEVRYWSYRELKKTFGLLIGPARIDIDGYFNLNQDARNADLLPQRYRFVIALSEVLKRASDVIPPIKLLADSYYVTARREGSHDY